MAQKIYDLNFWCLRLISTLRWRVRGAGVKYSIELSSYIYAPVVSLRQPLHDIRSELLNSYWHGDKKIKQKVIFSVRTPSFVIELTRQLYKVDSCIRTTPRGRIKGVEINSRRKSTQNTVDRRLGGTSSRSVQRDEEKNTTVSTGI
jgi:hypothetical protein